MDQKQNDAPEPRSFPKPLQLKRSNTLNDPSPFSQFCTLCLSPLATGELALGSPLCFPCRTPGQTPAGGRLPQVWPAPETDFSGAVSNLARLESVPKCKCKKSRCIQLYCECFGNGRECSDCGCKYCLNRPEHTERRNKAIQRSMAKRRKAKRREVHVKTYANGCRCKRSQCQKKYCECFLRSQPCGDKCSCEDCKNMSKLDSQWLIES